jgi:hypothetical protein
VARDRPRLGPDHPARFARTGNPDEDAALSNWHLSLFVQEIALQAGHAMRAWRELHAAIAADDVFRVFYHLQAYLGAVAILRLTLWPTHGSKERGADLRYCLHVADDSPLRDHAIRDAFAHFDERLDSAIAEGLRAWVDINAYADVDDGSHPGRLRHLDPARMRVSMRGIELDLRPLHEAVLALAAETRAPHWQHVEPPERIAGAD